MPKAVGPRCHPAREMHLAALHRAPSTLKAVRGLSEVRPESQDSSSVPARTPTRLRLLCPDYYHPRNRATRSDQLRSARRWGRRGVTVSDGPGDGPGDGSHFLCLSRVLGITRSFPPSPPHLIARCWARPVWGAKTMPCHAAEMREILDARDGWTPPEGSAGTGARGRRRRPFPVGSLWGPVGFLLLETQRQTFEACPL